jgi:multidrug efflux pump subunit AcrB
MLVTLTHRSQRKRMQVAVEDEIRHRLRDLPAVRVAIISGEPGSSLRIPLGSNDLKTLDSVVPKIMEDLHTLKGIGNVTSTVSLQRPEIHIAPYMERAADLGVTSEALLRAVRIATSGDYQMYLPKLNLPQRQVPIRMRLDSTQLPSLEAIRQMPVAARGGSVPLEAVADIRLGSGPAQIERLDRMYNISFDIELGGRQLGEVLAEAKQLPSLTHLPSGVKYLRDGDAANMEDLFSRFTVAIVCGVICIYVVLVLLFHDFLQPVTILVALPLSLGGAFGALLATHNAISLPSIFGILMLMGIVTKNSILLVDYTITARRERQIDRIAALIEACHKRARPILMTTLAMGAGMLPVALGFGADPSFRSPMAIAVIGGLITSTLLSLLVIPVVYTYVDDLKEGLLRVRLTRPD